MLSGLGKVLNNIDYCYQRKYMLSGLGKVFRAAKLNPEQISSTSFMPYEPSYGALASFISTGVFDEKNTLVGVVSFQVSGKPLHTCLQPGSADSVLYKDRFGKDCQWYSAASKRSPFVCHAHAEQNCPVACRRSECYRPEIFEARTEKFDWKVRSQKWQIWVLRS